MSIQRTLGHSPQLSLSATQKNIDCGVERNSNHCVVADAIKEARPDLKYISVDIQTIRATDTKKKERYVWITPRAVQQFIIDFDRGDKSRLKPFKTTLRIGQTITAGHTVEANKKRRRKSQRAKLRTAKNGGNTPPVPVGGKAPPRAVGQRRQYGLRSLVY